MEQRRSNTERNALLMDAQTMFRKEECALDMERRSKSSADMNALLVDAQSE